jgi:ABC-type transport system involved in cytochrome bd biosynthesis fused ATPase/permease subunit
MTSALKRAWEWLKGHWYVPFFCLSMILGWLIFRKSRDRGTPIAQTRTELKAIEAESNARKAIAELGAAQARALVEANYQAELQKLTDIQKKEVEVLRDDPAKLAAYLVRAGSGK